MNAIMSPEIREVTEAVHYRPAISIIIPLAYKTGGIRNELEYSLKIITHRVEQELRNNYPPEIYQLVIQKLKTWEKHYSSIPLKKVWQFMYRQFLKKYCT